MLNNRLRESARARVKIVALLLIMGVSQVWAVDPWGYYKQLPWADENGLIYMSASRWNDPSYDRVAEAKDIADYLHQTDLYAQLPKALKEKLDANQANYSIDEREDFYGDPQNRLLLLYMDRNINIFYTTNTSRERLEIDMDKYPYSLKGYVMASYEPSPAIDRRTRKPYFAVPQRVLKQLSPEEQTYFETFLDVVNENYHFLTAYPLLELDSKKFKDGEYWAKFVPAPYLVTDGSVPKPEGYQSGLKDEIQTRLGAPVYDLSEMKVKYIYSDCSEYNELGELPGAKGAGVGFFRYDSDWTLEDLQIRTYSVQSKVRRVSLEQFKKGLDDEYQVQKPFFSKRADFIYQKLLTMIVPEVDKQLSRLPDRFLSTDLYNLPKFHVLKRKKAVITPGDPIPKIRAE